MAIAYGYNNIARTLPAMVTVGGQLPLNCLSDALRQECALAGWTEILTWALQSREGALALVAARSWVGSRHKLQSVIGVLEECRLHARVAPR